jgi:hypothetical protein
VVVLRPALKVVTGVYRNCASDCSSSAGGECDEMHAGNPCHRDDQTIVFVGWLQRSECFCVEGVSDVRLEVEWEV